MWTKFIPGVFRFGSRSWKLFSGLLLKRISVLSGILLFAFGAWFGYQLNAPLPAEKKTKIIFVKRPYRTDKLVRETAPEPDLIIEHPAPDSSELEPRTVIAPKGLLRVGLVSITPSGLLVVDRKRNWIRVPVIFDGGAVRIFEYRLGRSRSAWSLNVGAIAANRAGGSIDIRPSLELAARYRAIRASASVSGPFDSRPLILARVGIRIRGNE